MSLDPWDEETAAHNTKCLFRLLQVWEEQDRYYERASRPRSVVERARAYAAKEPPAVSGQSGHGRCFHVACVLVNGFALDEDDALEAIQDWNASCQPPWSEKELRHKLQDALKKNDGERGYLLNAKTNGHHTEGQAAAREKSDKKEHPEIVYTIDQIATGDDLLEHNATIRWAWEKWLPLGVVTVLASEPGVGKTRFCLDLARRVYHGLPWPDGSPQTFPAGSPTLWVPADNQHAELGSVPKEFGFPTGAIYLNARKTHPFEGTLLDGREELRDFEARIKCVKPAIVFVDTSLNATDKSAHKPEDAKAFFVPLQQIAARTGIVLICVTHLNAAGKPLGRRIQGQARLVMQLEQPDPDQEHRRKLYVVKSNSLLPAALGVTMGSEGNTYDLSPPDKPADPAEGRPIKSSTRLQEVCEWLKEHLGSTPKRVSGIRTAAELDGISSKTLYAARDRIGAEEFEAEGKKWWQFTSE